MLVNEWQGRRKRFAPELPPCLQDPDHIPILAREHEQIEFRCAEEHRFAVSMGRDSWVEKDPNGPDYAFDGDTTGWHMNSVVVTVKQQNLIGGPKEQRFYKTHACIDNGGGPPLSVHPDGICDR